MSHALQDILASIEKRYGGLRSLDQEKALDQLVLLLLAKGVPARKAEQALQALREQFVDWNEVRVTEIADIEGALAVLGPKALTAKALALRDLLAQAYSRFNRMNLDFVGSPDDAGAARKYEKLFTDLEQMSTAFAAMMTCWVNGKNPELTLSAGAMRVLTRLGVSKKGAGVGPTRKKLESEFATTDWLPFVWGINFVADEVCLKTVPMCSQCVLKEACDTAPGELKRAQQLEMVERRKERAEAERLTAEKTREDRERKRVEAAQAKLAAKALKAASAARGSRLSAAKSVKGKAEVASRARKRTADRPAAAKSTATKSKKKSKTSASTKGR